METKGAANEMSGTALVGEESTPNSFVFPLHVDSLPVKDLSEASTSESTVSPLPVESPPTIPDNPPPSPVMSEMRDIPLHTESVSASVDPPHSSGLTQTNPSLSSSITIAGCWTAIKHGATEMCVACWTAIVQVAAGIWEASTNVASSIGLFLGCWTVGVLLRERTTGWNSIRIFPVVFVFAALLALAIYFIIWPKSSGL